MYLGVQHRFKLTDTCIVQRNTTQTSGKHTHFFSPSWQCRDTKTNMPAATMDVTMSMHSLVITPDGWIQTLTFTDFFIYFLSRKCCFIHLSERISPARRLKRSGGVGCEARVCAGCFRIHRAAVMVGVVVSPLIVAHHLERLTEVH